MYNGIGLTTPRGSGTNGFVQRNLASIRSRQEKVDYKTDDDIARMDKMLQRKPNKEILEHEWKRKIELRCLQLTEQLEEQGYTEVEVEQQVSALRASLSQEARPVDSSANETHMLAEATELKKKQLKSAFGIHEDYVEGSAFSREQQALRSTQREEKEESRKRKREKQVSESESESESEEEEEERSDSDSNSDSSPSSSSSEEERTKKKNRALLKNEYKRAKEKRSLCDKSTHSHKRQRLSEEEAERSHHHRKNSPDRRKKRKGHRQEKSASPEPVRQKQRNLLNPSDSSSAEAPSPEQLPKKQKCLHKGRKQSEISRDPSQHKHRDRKSLSTSQRNLSPPLTLQDQDSKNDWHSKRSSSPKPRRKKGWHFMQPPSPSHYREKSRYFKRSPSLSSPRKKGQHSKISPSPSPPENIPKRSLSPNPVRERSQRFKRTPSLSPRRRKSRHFKRLPSPSPHTERSQHSKGSPSPSFFREKGQHSKRLPSPPKEKSRYFKRSPSPNPPRKRGRHSNSMTQQLMYDYSCRPDNSRSLSPVPRRREQHCRSPSPQQSTSWRKYSHSGYSRYRHTSRSPSGKQRHNLHSLSSNREKAYTSKQRYKQSYSPSSQSDSVSVDSVD